MVQKASMENMCSKLPYEDISGKKPLFGNTYENKRKMNTVGR